MIEFIQGDLSLLGRWPEATFADVIELIRAGLVMGIMLDQSPQQQRAYAERVQGFARQAAAIVAAGQAIDVGHVPNRNLIENAQHAAECLRLGTLRHPFPDAYILFHTWDDASAAYIVRPIAGAAGFHAIELQCVKVKGVRMLALADEATVRCELWEDGRTTFIADLHLAPLRAMLGVPSDQEARDMVNNIADPVVVGMLLVQQRASR